MTIQRQKQNNSALWLVLGGAFVLRMILAGVTEGYPYDMSCFVAWAKSCWPTAPPVFTAGAILPTTRPATCLCFVLRRWYAKFSPFPTRPG